MTEGVEAGASNGISDQSLEELLSHLVRSLVETPDEVEVSPVEEPDALVLELRVGEGDLGRVIGRQGRTAKALRTLLSAAAAKARRRVILDIIET